MKTLLELFKYIETDYFWKEQMQLFTVSIDFLVKSA